MTWRTQSDPVTSNRPTNFRVALAFRRNLDYQFGMMKWSDTAKLENHRNSKLSTTISSMLRSGLMHERLLPTTGGFKQTKLRVGYMVVLSAFEAMRIMEPYPTSIVQASPTDEIVCWKTSCFNFFRVDL